MELSHLDAQGSLRQVDVSHKSASQREAIAHAVVRFPAAVFAHLQEGGFVSSKGSILEVARIAGIQASKRTAELIPLCHALPLDFAEVNFEVMENALRIVTKARVYAKTGVEMEALTACSVAALTVYDMCKALSHEVEIGEIRLLEKSGGKHDYKYHG